MTWNKPCSICGESATVRTGSTNVSARLVDVMMCDNCDTKPGEVTINV